MSKQIHLRKIKREARQALSDNERCEKSHDIVENVKQLNCYRLANRVALYMSMPEEVNVAKLINDAWKKGKSLYLPAVRDKNLPLQFILYTPKSILVRDAANMLVPDNDNSLSINASELDMVVLPLVAFDSQCHRIGMGGGFYDRTFSFRYEKEHLKPVLVGVGFETQRVQEKIITQAWDVSLDVIVSETRSYGAIKL